MSSNIREDLVELIREDVIHVLEGLLVDSALAHQLVQDLLPERFLLLTVLLDHL